MMSLAKSINDLRESLRQMLLTSPYSHSRWAIFLVNNGNYTQLEQLAKALTKNQTN